MIVSFQQPAHCHWRLAFPPRTLLCAGARSTFGNTL
jgi:hypothetical protein